MPWAESVPGGTIVFCSRYRVEIARPSTLRVFARGQFELFLQVCRRRGIRVIVDEYSRHLPVDLQWVHIIR